MSETKRLTLIGAGGLVVGAVVFSLLVMLAGLARGEPAAVDAGPAQLATAPLDAGAPAVVPVVTVPAKAAPVPPVEAKDPTVDPGGYLRDVRDAYRGGMWFLLVVLAMFGASRAMLWAASRWSLTWLQRFAPILVTVSSMTAAIVASLGASGSVDPRAVMGAVAAAIALYLTPAPKVKAEAAS